MFLDKILDLISEIAITVALFVQNQILTKKQGIEQDRLNVHVSKRNRVVDISFLLIYFVKNSARNLRIDYFVCVVDLMVF